MKIAPTYDRTWKKKYNVIQKAIGKKSKSFGWFAINFIGSRATRNCGWMYTWMLAEIMNFARNKTNEFSSSSPFVSEDFKLK